MDGMTFPANHHGKNRVSIAGRFRPNTAGAVNNDLNKGKGFSAARTGVGAFTVTLANFPHGQIDDVQWSLLLNAADDKFLVGGPVSAALGTLEVTVWDVSDAAAADITSHANAWICFKATIRDSSAEN